MKTVRHPTAGRVVNTVAQSRWGRWQTAELGLIFAPQSLLGGAHIHEMWSNPLIRKGFSDLKQKSRKTFIKPMISIVYYRFHVGVAFMNRRKMYDKI